MARCGGYLLALACAGCHVVFDLERLPDAATQIQDGEPDASTAFGAPTEIYELSVNSADDDPTVTNDELELYFNSFRSGGGGDGDIWRSSRASKTEPWGEPVSVSELNTTNNENTPRLSDDGLTLHLAIEINVMYEIHVAMRSSRTAPWQVPKILTELNTTVFDAEAMVTRDGLMMFLTSRRAGGVGGYDIYIATRETTADTWGPPALAPGLNTTMAEDCPFSRDGLTIYFSSNRPGSRGSTNLWMATRPTLNDPFGEAIPLDSLNTDSEEEDPHVSEDGKTIWFASARGGNFNIFVATR